MSLYDYTTSRDLVLADWPFNALVMAAMRRADSTNIILLKRAFPAIWEELQQRYSTPGGVLPEEVVREEKRGGSP